MGACTKVAKDKKTAYAKCVCLKARHVPRPRLPSVRNLFPASFMLQPAGNSNLPKQTYGNDMERFELSDPYIFYMGQLDDVACLTKPALGIVIDICTHSGKKVIECALSNIFQLSLIPLSINPLQTVSATVTIFTHPNLTLF